MTDSQFEFYTASDTAGSSRPTLFCIGVGPGNPELMTVQAVRTIRRVGCLAVPVANEDQISLAHTVVQPYLADQENQPAVLPLLFPMSGDSAVRDRAHRAAAERVIGQLALGDSVAMITIGDPTLYSTCFYVKDAVEAAGYPVQVLPGIPSVTAAAARAGIALSEQRERVHILPGVRGFEDIRRALESPDIQTLVVMKAGNVIDAVRSWLSEHSVCQTAVIISRLGFSDERIAALDQTEIGADWPYFTTMIIKKKG